MASTSKKKGRETATRTVQSKLDNASESLKVANTGNKVKSRSKNKTRKAPENAVHPAQENITSHTPVDLGLLLFQHGGGNPMWLDPSLVPAYSNSGGNFADPGYFLHSTYGGDSRSFDTSPSQIQPDRGSSEAATGLVRHSLQPNGGSSTEMGSELLSLEHDGGSATFQGHEHMQQEPSQTSASLAQNEGMPGPLPTYSLVFRRWLAELVIKEMELLRLAKLYLTRDLYFVDQYPEYVDSDLDGSGIVSASNAVSEVITTKQFFLTHWEIAFVESKLRYWTLYTWEDKSNSRNAMITCARKLVPTVLHFPPQEGLDEEVWVLQVRDHVRLILQRFRDTLNEMGDLACFEDESIKEVLKETVYKNEGSVGKQFIAEFKPMVPFASAAFGLTAVVHVLCEYAATGKHVQKRFEYNEVHGIYRKAFNMMKSLVGAEKERLESVYKRWSREFLTL